MGKSIHSHSYTLRCTFSNCFVVRSPKWQNKNAQLKNMARRLSARMNANMFCEDIAWSCKAEDVIYLIEPFYIIDLSTI